MEMKNSFTSDGTQKNVSYESPATEKAGMDKTTITESSVDSAPVVEKEETELIPVCRNCGAEIEIGQAFCPKCGTKVVNDIPTQNNAAQQNAYMPLNNDVSLINVQPPKKNQKTMIMVIAIVGAVLLTVIGVAAFLIMRGTPVEKIKLDKKSITIEENQFYTIKCKIVPSDATDKKVKWTTSDEDIAKVNKKGEVTAVSEGECKIIVEASNGIKAECDVKVEKAGPNLLAVYNELDDSYYCTLGTDMSYLEIDTNPLDLDDYSSYTAYQLVEEANELLGLPNSVMTKMDNTNALSGIQTYEGYKVIVSWKYHPDNGLEVIYERTDVY